MNRNWTYKEIQSLIAFRRLGRTVKECGRVLNRSRNSVRQQLHRNKIRLYLKSDISKKVGSYVKAGKTDAFIALKLNCSKWKVKYWRDKLSLKANQQRNKKHRARCFGCNKISPLTISKGWAKLCGWRTERLDNDSNETIAICTKCQLAEKN